MQKKIAIKIEDLTVSYADKPALWDIDLDIMQGSLCAIIGPNGAGKSTLIKSIPIAGYLHKIFNFNGIFFCIQIYKLLLIESLDNSQYIMLNHSNIIVLTTFFSSHSIRKKAFSYFYLPPT